MLDYVPPELRVEVRGGAWRVLAAGAGARLGAPGWERKLLDWEAGGAVHLPGRLAGAARGEDAMTQVQAACHASPAVLLLC